MLIEAFIQMGKGINRYNIQLKINYFTNKIALQNGDIDGAWKTINLVLHGKPKMTNTTSLDLEGKQICNNNHIAESMNQMIGRFPTSSNFGHVSPIVKGGLEIDRRSYRLISVPPPLVT